MTFPHEPPRVLSDLPCEFRNELPQAVDFTDCCLPNEMRSVEALCNHVAHCGPCSLHGDSHSRACFNCQERKPPINSNSAEKPTA